MTTDGGDRTFGAPRFDIVLRGYDRRQVDEHLSRLQRVLSRMRGDLEAARSHANPPPPLPPGLRPRPTPRRRPDGSVGDQHDVVGTFTDRMQTILQAAEDEAAEIRAKARADAERLASSHVTNRVEEEKARATLMNLVRQRDAVLADLTRVRGQLEALLSGPTARIAVPSQDAGTAAAARRDAGAGHPLPGTPAGGVAAVGGARAALSSPREGGLRPPSGPPNVLAGVPSDAGRPGATRPGASAPPDGARPDGPGTDDRQPDDTRAEDPAEGASASGGAATGSTADAAVSSAVDPDAPTAPEGDAGAGSGESAGAEDAAGSPEQGPEDTLRVGAVGHSPSRS